MSRRLDVELAVAMACRPFACLLCQHALIAKRHCTADGADQLIEVGSCHNVGLRCG